MSVIKETRKTREDRNGSIVTQNSFVTSFDNRDNRCYYIWSWSDFTGKLTFLQGNLICFKILNNLAPDYLVDLIHVYEPTRNLRSSSDKWRLTIKPYNLKTYGFRAFSVIAPILWNDLPIDIRSIDDVNKFKCKLKTFLFKRVYELS